MKLESYQMREALVSGDTDGAIKLLADIYGLPHPGDVPFSIIPSWDEVRLLFWAGDDYYEWSSSTGFDNGTHPMSGRLPRLPSDQITSIILWNRP